MVLINNKKINFYDFQTKENIIEFIAALAMKKPTISKYLYFPKGIPNIDDFFKENYNIEVKDVLQIIIENSKDSDISNLVKIIEPMMNKNIEFISDIFNVFIVYNTNSTLTKFNDINLFKLLLKQNIENNLDPENIYYKKINNLLKENSYEIEKVWDNKTKIIKDIKEDINLNQKNVEKIQKINKKLNEGNIEYTDFELQYVSFDVKFTIKNISIMELFNYIKLDSNVIFSSINNIYKILKNFEISDLTQEDIDTWVISLENAIILKISHLKNNTESKVSNYTTVIISIDETLDEKNVKIEVDNLPISYNNISKNDFISRIFNIFSPEITDFQDLEVKEYKVKGVFYFPKRNINIYVLQDLIMNNPIFSSMLSINENDKATKSKDSIYLYFKNDKIGYITATLTEKISVKNDPLLKYKDIENTFPYNSTYIRILVNKSNDLESVKNFQSIFSKLLYLYYSEYESIKNFYKKYIKNFGKEKKQSKSNIEYKKTLRNIAPEIFPRGWAPECNNKPIIINTPEGLSEDQKNGLEKIEINGSQIMPYPIQTKIDSKKTRYYMCDKDSKFKYPGLKKNTKKALNIEKYPYFPCCYEVDQSAKKGTSYREYYYDEIKEDKSTKQQHFITTYKFVEDQGFGDLPKNIENLLNFCNPNENQYKFFRLGVMKETNSSFLECVLTGIEDQSYLGLINQEERKEYINNKRLELSTDFFAASCKQELYDFTIKEILEKINDLESYFDPYFFTNLLEIRFNCNIIVFKRDINNKVKISTPRHIKGYYKTLRKKPFIFIYEHVGSKTDRSVKYRCELIKYWNKNSEDDHISNFKYNSEIYNCIDDIYKKINESYILNIKLTENLELLNNKEVLILGQGIDFYGKCRMIRFEYNEELGTVLTPPLQPLAKQQIEKWNIVKLSYKNAIQLCKLLNVKNIRKIIDKDMLKSLSGYLNNIKIIIPVKNYYSENKFSDLSDFIKYKKLSRYIVDYIFWLYSKYLKENSSLIESKNLEKNDDIIINDFVKKNIIIDSDFNYTEVSKKFSMYSGVMKDSKLVIKSEKTLERLLYVLKLYIIRNSEKISKYYDNIFIENYYVDITDFDNYQYQIILEGEDSLNKWLREKKFNYFVYNNVKIDNILNEEGGTFYYPTFKSYFFKNKLINNSILLAQNTDNLNKAIKISKTWNKDKYNIGENVDLQSEEDLILTKNNHFVLYSYQNSENIVAYSMNNSEEKTNIKILLYKFDNEIFYTSLLQI
jgi:hypothetical protein